VVNATDVADVSHKHKIGLKKANNRGKEKLGALKKALNDVAEMKKKVHLRADNCRDHINNAAQDALVAIEKRKLILLDLVQELEQGKQQVLEEQFDKLEQIVTALESCCSLGEQMLNGGSEVEVVITRELLLEKLQDAQRVARTEDFVPREDDDISFTPAAPVSELVGKVSSSTPFPSKCLVTNKSGVVGRIMSRRVRKQR